MKKVISILVCLVMLMGMASVAASAETVETAENVALYPEDEVLVSQTVETREDGSSLIVTVSQKPQMARAGKTYSGSKTYTEHNSSGEVLWQFVIKGTFTVSSNVPICTSATHSYKIVKDEWSCVSHSATKAGNVAIGNGKFERKLLFITMETATCTVKLSCDKNGKLS